MAEASTIRLYSTPHRGEKYKRDCLFKIRYAWGGGWNETAILELVIGSDGGSGHKTIFFFEHKGK